MADKTMPPLPTGSVDLDALHAADAKGEDLGAALENAIIRKEPMTEEEFAELPSLAGKTKAELLKIAEAEGVEASDAMTNAAIIDAITIHRAVAPVVDGEGNPINPPPGEVTDEPAELGDDDA